MLCVEIIFIVSLLQLRQWRISELEAVLWGVKAGNSVERHPPASFLQHFVNSPEMTTHPLGYQAINCYSMHAWRKLSEIHK
jgi:hypothetical protein